MVNQVKVEIIENNSQVILEEETINLIIGETGPQGPVGTLDLGQISYIHTQAVPESTWTVVHNLGFVPNITVVDSAGSVVEGSYSYPSGSETTTAVLNFSGAFSGKAYLS